MDEVPHDQEVVREAHLLNGLELETEPLGQLRGHGPVAPDETFLAELDEVVERVPSVWHRVAREQDPAQLDLDVAPLRDLERAGEGMVEAREVESHLLGRLEEELVRVESPVVRVLERVPRLDAEERFVRVRVLCVQVVDVARGDERKARLLRESDQVGIDAQLVVDSAVLDLDVRGVAPVDLRESVEVLPGVLAPALGERFRDATGKASRECDEAPPVAFEELPVDPWLVVVPLEVAERAELDQVGVPLVRLGEEREVRVALRLNPTVVGHVDLAADDGLDSALASLPIQLDDPREGAVVGERDGRHLEPLRLLDKRRYPARPVEDRVLGVDVQMDERRGVSHGRAIVLRRSDSRISPCSAGNPVGYPVSGRALTRPSRAADSGRMAQIETDTDFLRDRALVLAEELGLDRNGWYFRVLDDSRGTGAPTDLGVLVRAYWELQRVTGRSDLREDWRRLADALWQGDAA